MCRDKKYPFLLHEGLYKAREAIRKMRTHCAQILKISYKYRLCLSSIIIIYHIRFDRDFVILVSTAELFTAYYYEENPMIALDQHIVIGGFRKARNPQDLHSIHSGPCVLSFDLLVNYKQMCSSL